MRNPANPNPPRWRKAPKPGGKFGEFRLIRDTGKKSGGAPIWEAECSCGTVKEVSLLFLQDGRVKSCGCSRKRIHRRRALETTKSERFGKLFKAAVERQGRGAVITLAKKLKTSPTRLYDIAAGRSCAVSPTTIKWLGDALGISEDELGRWHYAAALDAGFAIDGIPRGIFLNAGEGI